LEEYTLPFLTSFRLSRHTARGIALTRGGFALCAALLLAAISQRALAAPPFLTDDPEPADYKHYEVYFAGVYSGYKPGYFSTVPLLEVNYGAAPNLQLSISTQMVLANPTGGTTQYGFGDVDMGAKYRFIQETKYCPQVSIFPSVELPTGDFARGLGLGRAAVYLPIWMQKSWGKWTLIGGGGYWMNPGPGNSNYWYSGLLLQKQVTKRLNLGCEVFYNTTPILGGPAQAGVNFGGTYDFDEVHHLLFSAGDDIHGSGKGIAYLGYGWTWGPKEEQPPTK
jgi:hypothetical protein